MKKTEYEYLNQAQKIIREEKCPCESCVFMWSCTGFHVKKFNCRVIKSDVVQVKNEGDTILKCEVGICRHLQNLDAIREQEAEKCPEQSAEPSRPLQRE